MSNCPGCSMPVRSLTLMPMNFQEIDAAREAAANMAPSDKRGKKRKNATIARLNPSSKAASVEDNSETSDLRTGRWTHEETMYCDKLIEKFEGGELPIPDNLKLNDFLSSMLKSKQSRLTKKMKNAKLSAKTYRKGSGFIQNLEDARDFAMTEASFYESIQCDLERAEIRFHMQKEWREHFSNYCVAMGQKIDADPWLTSVEELDRRNSAAKDAARLARRKVMMGQALSKDTESAENGVFIDNSTSADRLNNGVLSSHVPESASSIEAFEKRRKTGTVSLRDFSSPFVGKVVQYLQRHNIPFEHIDAWVPSFVPGGGQQQENPEQKCQLCFAGFATTDVQVPEGGGNAVPLSSQDHFDLLSFGEYSQKFSFDVGCGLPGRVYSSGICSWEQGVENAPSSQFERCGGAMQWGIKTVLGIPIPSPNVGRIVVLLYSRHDRRRDPEMVRKITEELTKVSQALLFMPVLSVVPNCQSSNLKAFTLNVIQLMPTPKWKLVVDVGVAPPKSTPDQPVDHRVAELMKIMVDNVPTHKNSPHAPYLPGFTSLKLLLMKDSLSDADEDLLSTILESYSSYLNSGRSESDTAWMIARDYMLLAQTSNLKEASSGQQHQQQGSILQNQSLLGSASEQQLLTQALGQQQQLGQPSMMQFMASLQQDFPNPAGGNGNGITGGNGAVASSVLNASGLSPLGPTGSAGFTLPSHPGL